MIVGGRKHITLSMARKSVELQLGCLSLSSDMRKFSKTDFQKIENDYRDKLKDSILPLRSFDGMISDRLKKGCFAAIITKEGTVTGAIIADINTSDVYKGCLFSMEFFNTNLTGLLAAKSLILAHRGLIAQGIKLDADYATTTCFYKDINHDFNKILSKDGWRSQGYMSVYDLRSERI